MHHNTQEAIVDKIWACENLCEDALAAYCARFGFGTMAELLREK
jgi:hypothetical protein